MAKLQKVVWPRGKNLKPAPKGRERQQPIPAKATLPPRSAETAERRRQVDQGLYPMGEPIAMLVPGPNWPKAETLDQQRALQEWLRQANLQMAEMMMVPAELLQATPREATGVPVANSLEELMELATTYGTAIMLVKAPST
jgi:hypothetical protein